MATGLRSGFESTILAAMFTKWNAAGAAGNRRSGTCYGLRAMGSLCMWRAGSCRAKQKRRSAPGLALLFAELEVAIDPDDLVELMVFPEMDAAAEMPEITEACWGILGRSLESVMCTTVRMVVKRKGAAHPVALGWTLLP